MTTITASTGSPASTAPDLVLGYETGRASGTKVHTALSGDIAVVLAPARPRSGTLRLLYQSEAAAFAAVSLHSRAATFTLSDAERSRVHMQYTLSEGGQVRLALDETTLDAFVVTVDYQEIIP
ncbi:MULTISPECIES: hypothetical protein [unclassified Microbacterium]|uniref:hypothetical protein n=1 Tax=unclassified Microbacterium TaxID=2609290 RepID=UPI00301A2DDD